MSSKASRRTYQPPVQAKPAPAGAEIGSVVRGGLVHRTYVAADEAGRRDLLGAIGLKACQRVGHRHKIPELRLLREGDAWWTVVDAWATPMAEQAGGRRAFADLFDGLVRTLIERARELLGDHADEPGAEHLQAMSEALAEERSEVQARVLLAAVVELDFTAAPEALIVAAADERFTLPEPSALP